VKEAIEMMFENLFQELGSQTILMSKLNKAVSPPISLAVDWNVSLDCFENCKID
jgi:hypothetical protein